MNSLSSAESDSVRSEVFGDRLLKIEEQIFQTLVDVIALRKTFDVKSHSPLARLDEEPPFKQKRQIPQQKKDVKSVRTIPIGRKTVYQAPLPHNSRFEEFNYDHNQNNDDDERLYAENQENNGHDYGDSVNLEEYDDDDVEVVSSDTDILLQHGRVSSSHSSSLRSSARDREYDHLHRVPSPFHVSERRAENEAQRSQDKQQRNRGWLPSITKTIKPKKKNMNSSTSSSQLLTEVVNKHIQKSNGGGHHQKSHSSLQKDKDDRNRRQRSFDSISTLDSSEIQASSIPSTSSLISGFHARNGTTESQKTHKSAHYLNGSGESNQRKHVKSRTHEHQQQKKHHYQSPPSSPPPPPSPNSSASSSCYIEALDTKRISGMKQHHQQQRETQHSLHSSQQQQQPQYKVPPTPSTPTTLPHIVPQQKHSSDSGSGRQHKNKSLPQDEYFLTSNGRVGRHGNEHASFQENGHGHQRSKVMMGSSETSTSIESGKSFLDIVVSNHNNANQSTSNHQQSYRQATSQPQQQQQQQQQQHQKHRSSESNNHSNMMSSLMDTVITSSRNGHINDNKHHSTKIATSAQSNDSYSQELSNAIAANNDDEAVEEHSVVSLSEKQQDFPTSESRKSSAIVAASEYESQSEFNDGFSTAGSDKNPGFW